MATIQLIKFAGENTMRRTCFALALLFVLPPACHADLFTITFTGLTDGQTLTTYTSQGFQIFDPTGFTAIGPGNQYYLGAIGLHPSGNYWFITETDGSSWTVTSLGFSFGLLGTPGEIDIDTFGIANGVTKYIIAMDTTNGLNVDAPQAPLPPVDMLRVTMNNSIPPYQVTEIRLGVDGTLASVAVPEPSTFVAAILSAVLWLGYTCWRHRRAVGITTIQASSPVR